jgi:hypothetical protein
MTILILQLIEFGLLVYLIRQRLRFHRRSNEQLNCISFLLEGTEESEADLMALH